MGCLHLVELDVRYLERPDGGFTNGTTYEYQVRAMNGATAGTPDSGYFVYDGRNSAATAVVTATAERDHPEWPGDTGRPSPERRRTDQPRRLGRPVNADG